MIRNFSSDINRYNDLMLQDSDIIVQYGTDAERYSCFAKPGTATSDAFWKIMKVTVDSDGNSTKLWATGTTAYIHVATSYASYTYS
jgi:hypothetical protein